MDQLVRARRAKQLINMYFDKLMKSKRITYPVELFITNLTHIHYRC